MPEENVNNPSPASPPRLLGRVKLALAAACAALLLVAGAYVYWVWHHPLSPGAATYYVKPGTSLRALAQQLYEHDVITEPYTLTWLGYITGRSREIKAGEYRFPPGISAGELLDQVVAGRVVEYPLVILEGWNFYQVMDALAAAPKLKQTLTGLEAEEVMARLGHPELHPEGRFFPDTYYYSRGYSDQQVLERAFDKMQQVLAEEWENRAPGLPYQSPDEALVLASIVEKETSLAAERPLVAAVFVNRLRRGMRLQADPTVIYGLGPEFDGDIRTRDLRRDTAYNTYTRRGLPPTPIAMPGRASLNAALHPADTGALYFVARGDGSHVFSETLEAHMDAVVEYQLGGRRR